MPTVNMNKFIVCHLLLAACLWAGVLVAEDKGAPGSTESKSTTTADAPECTGPDDKSCGKHKECNEAYKCVCTDGYTGEKCESCNVKSAGMTCNEGYCALCHMKDNNPTCVDELRTKFCQCLPGLHLMDNGVCEPGCTEDSCTEPNHHCNFTTFKCECKLGYEMIDGACKKKCPGGCGAHGICNNGTCWCNDRYIGTNCEVPPTCTDEGAECGENGTCKNYKCECDDGFRGEKCEEKLSCGDRCRHGICEQETCKKCENGYTGKWCEVAPACTGPADKSCGEHGNCTVQHECNCTGGYTGEKCKDPPVCTGTGDKSCGKHGNCTAKNECECKDGYSGKKCEAPCNGHGELNDSTKNCNCTGGHTGDKCEIAPVCAGPDDESCGEHGTCTDEHECVCTDGYSGDTCETPCNGHGTLDDSTKNCECEDGFSGDTCENAPVCAGPDDDSCGEHKECTEDYECECTDGYSGEKCDVAPECTGPNDDKSCGKHKECTDEYTCDCADGYTGDECKDAPVCTGPDDKKSCGEHEKCTDKYECECTDKYTGKNCAVKAETSSLPHNFLAYLLVALVVCIVGYVGWHNRHKVLGLVVEGQTGKNRVRSKSSRPNNKDYSRLEENVSDTLSKGSSKTYIF